MRIERTASPAVPTLSPGAARSLRSPSAGPPSVGTTSLRAEQHGLLSDVRGVAQTEYAVVLVLVALLFAVAVGSLALPLLQHHDAVLGALTVPGI